MNTKKFLIIVLLFGILRICHAAPMPFIESQAFQLPQAQNSSVNIYPCLLCNSHTQSLQEGLGIQIMF